VQEPAVRLGSHSNNLCGVHKDFFELHDRQIRMGQRGEGQGTQGLRQQFWDRATVQDLVALALGIAERKKGTDRQTVKACPSPLWMQHLTQRTHLSQTQARNQKGKRNGRYLLVWLLGSSGQ
jgi:hypothetical protein